METIEIRTLGEFSLRVGDRVISDVGNRSRKVWTLLAYLICHRGKSISQKNLISLFWAEDDSANPENAFRITLHRIRTQLDKLYEGAGRVCILHQDGGYRWNEEVPIRIDCDRFDALCLSGTQEPELREQELQEALSLYRGEFLPKQSSEVWVIPICAHFQNQYLTAALEAARLLSRMERHDQAAAVCRAAAASEPYHEELHQILMQELSAAGDPKAAAGVYETLCKRLFDDFGIRPSEETRAVYRAAAHSPEDRTLPMDEILEYLQEPEGNAGAMVCDYDYFKVLCYAESRAMERSGNATHVALLSISGPPEKPLSKRSLDRVMGQLGDALRMNLRRGDTISRCSVSQYIIMLPKANYENSCMVCRRVIGAFQRAHPHMTARVQYMVQPLTPSICVP